MTRPAPLVVAACALLSLVTLAPEPAQAQPRRVARPRAAVVRPVVVVGARPTVFVGGFYFPSMYRASLYYGYGPRFGPAYSQWPYGGFARYDLSGSIRLQVSPRDAEVYVDGYYAGTVDDFDGIFQRLHVEPGDHDVELYLDGYRTFHQRVYVQPERTFRIRHLMEPLAPGEPPPARPGGVPAPRAGSVPRGAPVDPRNRAPAPVARDFGELALRVQPSDAEVLIDGERWEGTVDERLIVQLGAGVHRLEIRKDGYRSYFTDLPIRGGQTTTLNVALTPQ